VNEIVSAADPGTALRVNGEGTYRLLQASRAASVKRFIYFSTFHVYGPWAIQSITEETPTRPVHPYAFTHRLAEDYVNWFRHSGDMETVVLRLSNGYGYPMDSAVDRWSLVFNDLCYQAVANGEIVLRSPGTQHRDFIALADVALGVEHFMDLPHDGWADGLFNLGGECSLSIIDVAKFVADEFYKGYGREIQINAPKPNGPITDQPVRFSINKLKETGFRPAGDMASEVKGTFAVCEQLVNSKGNNS
jgi:UDP-glucose 4-epimerase